MKKLIVKGGHLVDPANGTNGVYDILIENGRIKCVDKIISQSDNCGEISAEGKFVIPGLVDSHVHISSSIEGHYMLAKAGVTSCLDMSGYGEPMRRRLAEAKTGLTAGFLYPVIPGKTVSGENPGKNELCKVIGESIETGGSGIKILGGHFPLTPEATARAIASAAEMNVYCAVHAGTTVNGSNINGLKELIGLAENNPLHIAHINSYCRGQITGDPPREALAALDMLKGKSHFNTESYLALINGCSAEIVNGEAKSNVTKTCLERRGYSTGISGIEDAIRDGWAKVFGRKDKENELFSPEAGLAAFRNAKTKVNICFKVNSPVAAITLAAAKDDKGFIIGAISTDGGSIPRNTTLIQGLPLVKFGALTMSELVLKNSSQPAGMLGLKNKGHLGSGADADLVILDRECTAPETVIAGGTIIVSNGEFAGRKESRLFTMKNAGKSAAVID